MLFSGFLALALVAQVQTPVDTPLKSRSKTEAAAPLLPHIGPYTPNSQLLEWCKSGKETEFALCVSYIDGVLNSAGIIETKWPKGWVSVPVMTSKNEIIATVVKYLEKLPPERMSNPASESVYEAIVAVYPYKPDAIQPIK